MLFGPVLVLLLVLLFYKRPVNTMGIGWNARLPPLPPVTPPSVEQDPMDLNDVFRRPSR